MKNEEGGCTNGGDSELSGQWQMKERGHSDSNGRGRGREDSTRNKERQAWRKLPRGEKFSADFYKSCHVAEYSEVNPLSPRIRIAPVSLNFILVALIQQRCPCFFAAGAQWGVPTSP